MMKKESLVGFCLFVSFLYGINNILQITFNVKNQSEIDENILDENKNQSEIDENILDENKNQSEIDENILDENKNQSEIDENILDENILDENKNYNYDELNKIDILINEINTIELDNVDEKVDILESSVIRNIENDIFTLNNIISKKKYLIELNDKLTDIKTSLVNLKNEMEFCNSTTFYL